MERSEFYRSVHVNYPRSSDRQWAEENDVDLGVTSKFIVLKMVSAVRQVLSKVSIGPMAVLH